MSNSNDTTSTSTSTTILPDDVAAVTPGSIPMSYYRLLALRAQLRIQAAGMKTRSGSIRKKIAAELGLKPRDSYEVFIARINELIEEAKLRAGQRAGVLPKD
ncbi:hypothetical protein FDH89_gp53 [Pseudomonas phage phiR18]|uniref:Uncharacterized protein n=1 Tax=Pseudomonas phage phiR18 TaxID=1752027 RepID=A0A0S3UFW7_9CAUD|nr:hypothetical protein FDH89_gp53 [Pseudomonas phage phiR18]BAU16381.1 hypothetical protein [Pseudomonas phage phiR18]